MVFNAILSNISAIAWRSDLFVEETEESGENDRQKCLVQNWDDLFIFYDFKLIYFFFKHWPQARLT
jgi:hypothetical protein